MKDNHVTSLFQVKIGLRRNFNDSAWISRLQISGQVVSTEVTQKAYQVIKPTESKTLQLLVLTWHSEASGVLFDPHRLVLQMVYTNLTFQELGVRDMKTN